MRTHGLLPVSLQVLEKSKTLFLLLPLPLIAPPSFQAINYLAPLLRFLLG